MILVKYEFFSVEKKEKEKENGYSNYEISEAAFCIFLVGGKKSTRLFFFVIRLKILLRSLTAINLLRIKT